ncbi:MAG: hypothetical protein ACRBN8_29830 [Nannocystales bacterium]
MQTQTNHEPIAQAALLSTSKAPPESVSPDSSAVTVSLEAVDGKVAVAWTTGTVGRWDYVALFSEKPAAPPTNYLRGQWEYVSDNTSPLLTNRDADGSTAYWGAYCAYDYAQESYVVVQVVGPQTVG